MSILIQKPWQVLTRRKSAQVQPVGSQAVKEPHRAATLNVEIAPDDPLLGYLLKESGAVEISKINFDSPAVQTLKEAGVKIVVPLISQGELIGMLNLGARMSEQEYSTDDHRLLSTLATQAAPALRVAQLAQQQKAEARELERLEQELRVARIIQETLLPKELPDINGWKLTAHWQPARAVSGDFYDFIAYPDGKLGIFVGDVTDKGVPAALVMATTRSLLRGAAERLISPGKVLERANNLLVPDIPPHMFVTCLYALLDPQTGQLVYANAGHNPPYQHTKTGVDELRATGMPLGLLPDMNYEEKEAYLNPGDFILLYSDGLVEAHNAEREIYSFPRLKSLIANYTSSEGLIPFLLEDLAEFTGPDWEQEDDVTFVTLNRTEAIMTNLPTQTSQQGENSGESTRQTLAEFSLPSQPGNERQAMAQVAQAIEPLHMPTAEVERLKTAVAEATMNAMEHGNKYNPDLAVAIRVAVSADQLSVSITDHGGDKVRAPSDPPNLEAKLEGLQSPRGWGLFLIKNMVDEMRVVTDANHHTIELLMNLKGGDNGKAAI